jgi:hypothetical protein
MSKLKKLNAISFMDHDVSTEVKNKTVYKNFINIITYTLCMTISLGVNEFFLCFLEEKTINKRFKTFLYVFFLLIITIIFAYFLNLSIEL